MVDHPLIAGHSEKPSGGWYAVNFPVLETMYPALAMHTDQAKPEPAAEPVDEEWAQRQLDECWDPDVELHVLFDFINTPLFFLLFDRINQTNLMDNGNRRLFAVDHRFGVFRAALDSQDWRLYLNSEWCLFALNTTTVRAVYHVQSRYPDIAHGAYRVYAGAPDSDAEGMETVRGFLQTSHETIRTALQEYVQVAPGKVPPPFPRTVRFFSPGHNYIQDASVNALRAMGYDAGRLGWKKPIYRFLNTVAWVHAHRSERMDLGFFINATPKSFTPYPYYRELGLRSMAWFVDNPRRYAVPHTNIFENCGVIGVFDRTYIPYVQQYTEKPVVEARTAFGIDESRVKTPNGFDGTEIAFVGELGADAAVTYEKVYRTVKPEIIGWVNDFLKEADVAKPVNLDPAAEAFFRERGVTYEGQLATYLENKAAFLRRRFFLESIADLDLAIFGENEWANPKYAGEAARCYAGKRLDYFEELPSLYAAAKININIFHPQCVAAPNPRVYDVLACGGFLLTTWNPGLEDEFVIGQDLDVFRTRDELREKVLYYLPQPDLRRAMAQSGKMRALAKCGYHDRIQIFLSAIRQGEPYVYICG